MRTPLTNPKLWKYVRLPPGTFSPGQREPGSLANFRMDLVSRTPGTGEYTGANEEPIVRF